MHARYTHIHIHCIHACKNACTHTCVHTCMCACMHVFTNCTHTCIRIENGEHFRLFLGISWAPMVLIVMFIIRVSWLLLGQWRRQLFVVHCTRVVCRTWFLVCLPGTFPWDCIELSIVSVLKGGDLLLLVSAYLLVQYSHLCARTVLPSWCWPISYYLYCALCNCIV